MPSATVSTRSVATAARWRHERAGAGAPSAQTPTIRTSGRSSRSQTATPRISALLPTGTSATSGTRPASVSSSAIVAAPAAIHGSRPSCTNCSPSRSANERAVSIAAS
jgi:hypothetical protein